MWNSTLPSTEFAHAGPTNASLFSEPRIFPWVYFPLLLIFLITSYLFSTFVLGNLNWLFYSQQNKYSVTAAERRLRVFNNFSVNQLPTYLHRLRWTDACKCLISMLCSAIGKCHFFYLSCHEWQVSWGRGCLFVLFSDAIYFKNMTQNITDIDIMTFLRGQTQKYYFYSL